MRIIPLSKLIIPDDRTRKEISHAALIELADDIFRNGLLHPPVAVERVGENGIPYYLLVAGERRVRAFRLLSEDKAVTTCGTSLIQPGEIAVTVRPDTSDAQLLEIEISENLKRIDITWQEKVQAIAKLHRARLAENADQTFAATASEIAEPLQLDSEVARKQVARALLIDSNLDDPRVRKAKSETEAWTFLNARTMNRFTTSLKERVNALPSPAVPGLPGPTPSEEGGELRVDPLPSSNPHNGILFMGRFQDTDLRARKFGAVIADPPYGIKAHTLTRQKTARHFYPDDEETALDTAQDLIRLAESTWLDPHGASLFIFCTPNLWKDLYDFTLAQTELSVWHRPLIWRKSREGLAPWGTKGFRYTYEMLFWAQAGSRGLLRAEIDVLDFPRSQRGKLHGAQKPVALYRHLMELCLLPGESVLDPCCGSGTIFPAAKAASVFPVGIEADPEYFEVAQTRLRQTQAGDLDDETTEEDTGALDSATTQGH